MELPSFDLATLINLLVEIVIVAVTAGSVVWKTLKSNLHSEIGHLEERLIVRLDMVSDDIQKLEGKVDKVSESVARNSEKVAVLHDRWERLNGE